MQRRFRGCASMYFQRQANRGYTPKTANVPSVFLPETILSQQDSWEERKLIQSLPWIWCKRAHLTYPYLLSHIIKKEHSESFLSFARSLPKNGGKEETSNEGEKSKRRARRVGGGKRKSWKGWEEINTVIAMNHISYMKFSNLTANKKRIHRRYKRIHILSSSSPQRYP